MKKKAITFMLPLLLGFVASALQQRVLPQDTVVIGKSSRDSTTLIPKSSIGTIIRIELDGAFGGSGYQWEDLTKGCPVLAFTGTARETDPNVIGSPEKLLYFYCVRGKKGMVKLDFALRRSWEKEPAQTYRHTLKVY